jgi:hypothetical protein
MTLPFPRVTSSNSDLDAQMKKSIKKAAMVKSIKSALGALNIAPVNPKMYFKTFMFDLVIS